MSLSPTKRWILYEAAPILFLESVPEHPLLAQVLFNRGLHTASDAVAFLRSDDAVVENPYRLIDMVPAVTRILQAIESGETICVYGDFDADGVTSTALMVNALQLCGARVGPYIPDRVDEGYGLNVGAIERIAERAGLLVTVDCGIRSIHEVEAAIGLGLDVVVTDHHSVGPALPPALAVINPQRSDCSSGFDYLAGVGVAYRLAQAVLRTTSRQLWSPISPDEVAMAEQQLLDLVAIGTVADMMPLHGQNRSLVRRGLAQLNETQRPGLQSLFEVADLRPGSIDSTSIAFGLGPRINAAGRLGESTLAYEMLRTTDPVEAYDCAKRLEILNKERRRLTDAALIEAEQQLASQPDDDPALVVIASPHFQPGIVGLVAGKLSERFYRPAVVVEQSGEFSRGSARSIPEFDISAALDEVSDLLVRHGGHSRAAGFTVETARLPVLAEALRSVAQRTLQEEDDLRPSLAIDVQVDFDQLDWALAEQFSRLEPMGQGNPTPLLLARDLRVREARTVGKGKHLKLVIDQVDGGRVLDGIAFNQGQRARHLPRDARIDAVFSLEVNLWQGRRRLQLNIQDLCSAQSTEVENAKGTSF
jgi:single-stranded-DNA-specific exonuclease